MTKAVEMGLMSLCSSPLALAWSKCTRKKDGFLTINWVTPLKPIKKESKNQLLIMTDSVKQIHPEYIDAMDKTRSRQIFLSVVVVMVATLIAPSFYRILGSKAWGLLGWEEAQWALFLTGRALFLVIFVLAAGIIGDFWGRRRVLLLTLAAYIACLIASMLLPVGEVSVALQTPLSILGVMIRVLVVTMVILSANDPRGRILNLIVYSALSGAASLLSPIISRELLDYIDIKLLYVLPLVLALVGFWLVTKNVQESRFAAGKIRNDGIALVVWTFGLCTLLFSGILQSGIGWKHPAVLVSFVLGGGLLLGLNRLSTVSKSKPWEFTLYYQRQLSITLFAGIVLHIALFAVLVQTYNFLYKVEEISPVTAAFALSPFLLGALMLGSLATRMNARIGMRDTLAAGLIAVAIPAIGLYLLKPGLSYWVIMPFLVLLGFGYILGNAPRLILLNASVPFNLSATIQSISSATVQLGSALAYSLVLTLLQGFTENAYVELLGNIGLSPSATYEQVAQLAAIGESFPLIVPRTLFLRGVDSLIKDAYVTGISQAMLVLAGVCILCAIVVHFGLQKIKDKEGD